MSTRLARNILAIETATDACSVAVCLNGSVREIHELIPRQHSQRLLGMLEELLPGGDLRGAGIEAIAYGEGPGSFTGLRVAASAAQGLAFAAELPAIGVSTLACQVYTALREGLVEPGQTVLSMIDARIDQTYFALYSTEETLPACRVGPGISKPEQLPVADMLAVPGTDTVVALGSGAAFSDRFPAELNLNSRDVLTALTPRARDLLPFADSAMAGGQVQSPEQVAPSYVQDRIGWKKLSEQGKRA
jgi:tRNA threonylcarbamoyladenosine biosynthesis protein TsaB